MPPSSLPRCTLRNRVWVVLHNGATPLPVDAAGAQAARIVTAWHECHVIVSDDAGLLRMDAVFHAFPSFTEANAYIVAAGKELY